jgi:AraC family ethanolamine operon transcriptional activator
MGVRHNQMSQGGYAADLKVITLSPGLTFSATAYEPAITSQGAPPRGKYAFAVPLANFEGVFLNHKSVGPDEVGIVRPNQEFYLFRPPHFECAMFFPDAAMVEQRCAAMFGRSLAEIARRAPTLRATRGAAAVFARHIAELSSAAVVDAKPLSDWAATHGGSPALAGELVDELLAIICPPEPLRGWSARQRVTNRAWEIVEDDDQGVVTVSELCARLGVPIRTLDDAFHACLGVAPKRFILGMRLNKVRRQLGHPADEATTVTRVATRFGFFHFGHFAQQYRRLFGESPSQTLSRAIGARASDR